MKLLILAVIGFAIYYLFFRDGKISRKSSSSDDAESMVECEECSTFISVKDAVIVNGKYYCSKECAKVK
jgi:uncharacterized protein